MSCASQTYVPSADPRTRLFPHPGAARPHIAEAEGEIHRARSREPHGAQLNAPGAVPDTTKADPEHIWGDEGPVNE